MFPAIFLDRDGVLIENVDQYVRSWADVEIFPDSLAALAALTKSEQWKIIIVTNQSVVGRGIISEREAFEINEQLLTVIGQAGGRVDGVYMCTHSPSVACNCRKPKPGLILQAASEMNLDLTHSFMIGDALSDIQAGKSAGVAVNILVRTGRGAKQSNLPEAQKLMPFLVYNCLEEIVPFLLSGSLLITNS